MCKQSGYLRMIRPVLNSPTFQVCYIVLYIWAKRVLRVIFDQNVYFSFFWMYIIFRFICDILSRISVKTSFLWSCKHGVYVAASFVVSVTSWWRNNMQNFTSAILFMNIICIAQWLSGANSEILSIFYRENMTSFLNYVDTNVLSEPFMLWLNMHWSTFDISSKSSQTGKLHCRLLGI